MKKIINYTIILLLLALFQGASATPVFARQASEVPLYLKYKFEKQTGRKWHDASFERRQKFIKQIQKQRALAYRYEKSHLRKIKIKKQRLLARKKIKLTKERIRERKRKTRAASNRRQSKIRKEKSRRQKAAMLKKIQSARSKSNRSRR